MKNIITKFKKLIGSINNISLKRKLIFLYIFCVFIPIVSINTIFYFVISHNVSKQVLTLLDESMERIKIGFTTNIEQCMQVIRTINLDSKLENALDSKYRDIEDYYDVYLNYTKEAVDKFLPIYSQIQKISIYTENNTIINGGNYYFLNSDIINSDWYKKLQSSRQNTVIYPYIESDKNNLLAYGRYLSVIRRLYDYKSINYTNKIIKIDIRLNSFLDVVNKENTKGIIYLIDDSNRIMFSNNQDIYNNYNEFKVFTDNYYTSKDIVISKNFAINSYMSGWKLIGVFPKNDIKKAMGSNKSIVIAVALFSIIISTLIILVISSSIKNRLEIVSKHLKDISDKKFNVIDIDAGEDEIGTLIKEFNNSTIKIKNLIEVVYEAEIQKTKAELMALQSQVNPHFLYNTLNTVRLRSVLKGELETAEIIKYMSKLFRRFLSFKEDLITIREEIELTKDFLEIQKYRYGDKLNYVINVDENALCYKIPKMCIQTLVENSSVHGIEMIDGIGVININIKFNEDELFCKIIDNGIGIEKEKLQQIQEALKKGKLINGSYGIVNIYKRLKLYFGEEVKFTINSKLNKGTEVELRIPIYKLEKYV
ncbi:two-component system, sensor histidine kinase YesM [Clostridium sp. USBA 49]|uniref:sensor histidine kinase n=1 Tax=Clostridium sp. USBA 49 TaxID=1881060 RepID=UPI00099B24AC|nr:sensor histidine kinase [Clostridium sp. USBA 49]SKA74194.1 two-component system, sensor histidine kinase YesM [Clostridium sp. USBA 49]